MIKEKVAYEAICDECSESLELDARTREEAEAEIITKKWWRRSINGKISHLCSAPCVDRLTA